MKTHKIVLATESLKKGGAEQIVALIAGRLSSKPTMKITVISFFNEFDKSILNYLKKNSIRVVFLNKKRGVDLRFCLRLRREIISAKPEIIHTHFVNHLKYFLPFRIPKIHTLHNDFEALYGKPKTAWIFLVFKLFQIIPVNISTKLNITFNRLPEAEVIFNGINLLKPPGIDRVRFQILNVGRLVEQKNQEALLLAFKIITKQCKTAKLLIAGTGNLEGKLKNLCSGLKLSNSVNFLSNCENVNLLMASSELFLLTSKWEGMPLVAIEALNNGCPVVSTDVGGVSDVIAPDSGVLTSQDPLDIANKAIKLLSDHKRLEQMSNNAKLRAQEFSAEKMANKYFELYNKILR